MSWEATLKVLIKDLELFKEACEENGLTLKDDLSVTKGSQFIGRLKDNKKDGDDGPTYQLVTDSDYVGSNRKVNVNKVMQSYSEKVCYRRIGSIGTILERNESEEGILLRIAVNA